MAYQTAHVKFASFLISHAIPLMSLTVGNNDMQSKTYNHL